MNHWPRTRASCGLRAILAAAYTFGFRRSELLRLRVRQVDLLARTIHLDAGTTKNDDGRTVKMTQEVWELLAPCVRDKEPDDHVFTRAGNAPVLDLQYMVEAYGLGGVAWTPLP